MPIHLVLYKATISFCGLSRGTFFHSRDIGYAIDLAKANDFEYFKQDFP